MARWTLGWVLAPALARGAETCALGSAEAERARQDIVALGQRVERAKDPAEVKALLGELEQLRATPCLRQSAEHGAIRTTSALALRTWWQDGGAEWLLSYLPAPGGPRRIVFPPELRRSLALEDQPQHGLAFLLCRSTEEACGRSTRGWLLRASEALRLPDPRDNEGEAPRQDAGRACAAFAQGQRRNYLRWRACLESHRPRVPALPLGSFRPPERGWLVLRGRRGHYHVCDEVRAYDLATGAAYVAQSCTQLALQPSGAVDSQRTRAGRVLNVERGRLSLDNLREAALLLFLAGEIEKVQVEAWHVDLPRGLRPVLSDEMFAGGVGESGWTSSAQTRLRWMWWEAGTERLRGELTWPDSDDAGQRHAAQLIRIAEAGLVPGRPPAPLPLSALELASPPGVSPLDAHQGSLDQTQQELLDALRRQATP